MTNQSTQKYLGFVVFKKIFLGSPLRAQTRPEDMRSARIIVFCGVFALEYLYLLRTV